MKIEIELSSEEWKEFKKFIDDRGKVKWPVSAIKNTWVKLAKAGNAALIKELKRREEQEAKPKVRREMQIKQKARDYEAIFSVLDNLGQGKRRLKKISW